MSQIKFTQFLLEKKELLFDFETLNQEIDKITQIIDILELASKASKETLYGTNFDINTYLRDWLHANVKQTNCILAGGGVDSTYILLQLSKIIDSNKLKVLTGKTKNNSPEVKSLSSICTNLGVIHHVIEPSIKELEVHLNRFIKQNDRTPNDIAQPIIDLLKDYALYNFKTECIIDGQYADTNMYCNPQNKFWILFKFFSILPSISIAAKIQTLKNKYLRHIYFALSSKSIKILYLCNIKINRKSIKLINSLLSRSSLDSEIIMQIIFKNVLLKNRESDKYKCSPRVLSPFDSDELFVDATLNRQKYRKGIFCFKYPIKNYISREFPEFRNQFKSRSFESN